MFGLPGLEINRYIFCFKRRTIDHLGPDAEKYDFVGKLLDLKI